MSVQATSVQNTPPRASRHSPTEEEQPASVAVTQRIWEETNPGTVEQLDRDAREGQIARRPPIALQDDPRNGESTKRQEWDERAQKGCDVAESCVVRTTVAIAGACAPGIPSEVAEAGGKLVAVGGKHCIAATGTVVEEKFCPGTK